MSYPQNTISVYTVGTGSSSLNVQTPVVQKRAPSTQDILYRIGQLWVDSVGKSSYQLITLSSSNGLTIATWNLLATNTGPLNTLQGSTGGVIAPIAGNLTIAAGTGMLSTVGTAGTITLNVNFAAPPALGSGTPAAVSATTLAATSGISVTGGDIINSHSNAGTDVTIEVTNSDNTNGASRSGLEIATGGASSGDPYLSFEISGVAASTMTMGLDNSASDLFVISNNSLLGTSNALTLSQAGALTATTTLTATLGNITATNGNLSLATDGNKLLIAATSSATCSAGTFALSGAATTVISNSAITASSLILLTTQALGTVVVASTLAVTSKIAATSFTVTPSQATDTSTVAYIIIN